MADSIPSSVLQQLAGQYTTPQSVPTIQRSQYLAQALQSLQDSAKQGIKSPTQLWTSLLAEGLLDSARSKSDRDLAGIVQSGQQQQNDAANANIGLPPSSTPAPAAPQVQPSAFDRIGGMMSHFLSGGSPQTAPGAPSPQTDANLQGIINAPPIQAGTGGPGPAPALAMPTASAPQMQPPQQPMPAIAPTGAAPQMSGQTNLAPQDLDAIVRTTYGEARGEHPVGQQAVASVILNRAKATGLSPSAIVSAPGQFAGRKQGLSLDPQSPEYQRILANVMPALQGNDPTNGADHFYAPRGMPNGQPPSWAQGQPQTAIGNHNFLALGPTTGAAPAPPPAPAPSGVGGAPPPAIAPPAPGMSSPAPQEPVGGGMPQGVPTGQGATPQEQALYQRLMANPQTRQQGMAFAMSIAERAAKPLSAPDKMMWGQDGRLHPLPGAETAPISQGPNGGVQQDAFGSRSAFTNPNMGALGPNQISNLDGSVSNRPVQQQPTFKIPGANGIFTNGPDGRPVKVADDSFTPKDLGDRLTKLQGSDQFKQADNSVNMYTAATQAAQRRGGISDVELRDFAARQFSGGVARQFNVNALDHAQGALLTLKQFFPELISGQKMSPQARAAVLQAMHDDAVQAQTSFAHLAQSDEAFAQSQGMSLKPYLTPLSRELPPVLGPEQIPNGMPGGLTPTHAAKLPTGTPFTTDDGRHLVRQ